MKSLNNLFRRTRKFVCLSYCFLLLICLNSCGKNWLDVKPNESITVPASLKDFQALLDEALSGNATNSGDPSYGEVGSDNFYITDDRYTGLQDEEKNAYTWFYQYPYASTEWYLSYARVLKCSIILDGLEKIKSIPAEIQTWNDIKGQALFHRARTFYGLSQLFAPPYIDNAIGEGQGIPLRLEADLNTLTKRSTLKANYDQIIGDLEQAKDLLPLNVVYKTRPSKRAVLALLARIYLSMEKYPEARKCSDDCLSLYDTLLDFNQLNPNDPFPIKLMNVEVIFQSNMSYRRIIGSNRRIDQSFYEKYNNNDLRKRCLFGSSAGLITFKGSYNGSIDVFNGLTVGELYLIRAECYAREGEYGLAMSDLNTLMKKRWSTAPGVTYPTITAANANEALTKVLAEREKELFGRGIRWSDLRRLNRDPRFVKTITRTIAGVTYKLEPNSYQYTFPIPDDVILKAGIPQNVGWSK